jgi:hypothetical protein
MTAPTDWYRVLWSGFPWPRPTELAFYVACQAAKAVNGKNKEAPHSLSEVVCLVSCHTSDSMFCLCTRPLSWLQTEALRLSWQSSCFYSTNHLRPQKCRLPVWAQIVTSTNYQCYPLTQHNYYIKCLCVSTISFFNPTVLFYTLSSSLL